MRSVLALTAIFLTAACVHEPGLSAIEKAEIRRYAPNADLENLTPAQVGALTNALHHGDGFDIPTRIYSILNR